MPFHAFSGIVIGTKKEEFPDIVERVRKVPGVKAVYVVAGSYDVIADIMIKNLEGLREILYEIRGIPGVLRTETWIELRTY